MLKFVKFSNFFSFAIFLTFKFLPNLPNLSNLYTSLLPSSKVSNFQKYIQKKKKLLLELPFIGVEGLFLVKIGEDVEIHEIFKFLSFCNFLTFKFFKTILSNLSNQIYTLLFYHLPKSQIFKNIYKKERNLPGFHRISRGNFFFPPSFFREDSFRFLRLLSIGVEALFLVTIGEDVEIRKIFKFLSFCNFFNFLKTFQIFQIVEFIHFFFIIFQSSKVSNFQIYTRKKETR